MQFESICHSPHKKLRPDSFSMCRQAGSERATFLSLKHATDHTEVCEGRDTKESKGDHGSEALPGLQCHLTPFFVSIDGLAEVVGEAEV